MAEISTECLSGIRIMICMARADGVLNPDERFALEDELAGLCLPEGVSVESLLAEQNDALALAKQIENREARDYVYAGVFSIAYCDRSLAEAEEKLLNQLREAWNIQKAEDESLARALDPGRQGEAPTGPLHEKVSDPQLRETEFNKLHFRYCIVSGITGAIPVPLVPDLMVVPMQVKLVYDVAHLFGTPIDKKTVQLLFETLGVGTGARIGISALCKLVPGWGSVVGATSSYATTFALGKVAYAYFKSDGKTSMEDLKPLFREEIKHGKEEFQKQKPALEEAQKAHAGTLRQLAYDLQAGKISQDEYERRIDALN
jgi:uncharacterized protein (DUF697 family)